MKLGDPSRTDLVLNAIDAWSAEGDDSWTADDIARLSAVRADRHAAAEAYFEAHAAEWDAIRSLHVPETAVEAAIVDALGKGSLGSLIDLGTGTGRMLELLGGRATSAIGIDRSPEMLRLARVKLAQANLEHIELQQGDIYGLSLPDRCADTVILHQVLHYAQHPAAAINEAGRLLVPGGQLLIVDFASHEKEELRSRAAHARLGFSDEQLAEWFEAAGLRASSPRALKGGELTVKIWLGVRATQEQDKEVAA